MAPADRFLPALLPCLRRIFTRQLADSCRDWSLPREWLL